MTAPQVMVLPHPCQTYSHSSLRRSGKIVSQGSELIHHFAFARRAPQDKLPSQTATASGNSQIYDISEEPDLRA